MAITQLSNGTATKVSEILGKAIAPSGSYKLISEGNGSTIKNLTSLESTFSRSTVPTSSLGIKATSPFTGKIIALLYSNI
ncbi:hypothetical protein [Mammaliicoccus lentus]|uniref:hypothetical protein n=1 Tax=Mammaliicoccus lentus TaxID=42858 RepID=UPI0010716B2D|nr:hypothetical protein [Mammaliicoccus lentus]MBF0749835.1 hypothetical protein [Mammaliicoccus lentus]